MSILPQPRPSRRRPHHFAARCLFWCLACSVTAGLAFAGTSASEEAAAPSILAFASPESYVLPISPSPAPDPRTVEVPKRLFGVIPNFRADQYHEDYVPLSAAQKFEIARHDSFDLPNYFLLVGYALQTQMTTERDEQKPFIQGFGEAYGRSVADQIAGSYITEALLPSLLHEDPRFFRLGAGTFWHRASHAASAVVISRRDNGTHGFAYSEMLGNAGAVALSTAYYTDNRTASDAIERYSMAIGNDIVSNLLTEFWPDMKRRLPLVRH